jgi:aldehyde:ferredoxin oxidoreductase
MKIVSERWHAMLALLSTKRQGNKRSQKEVAQVDRPAAGRRKGSIVDRAEFERMKDEYYHLRQWDIATGLQTTAKLEQLGLRGVAQDLEHTESIA